jgi:hypothetical protein
MRIRSLDSSYERIFVSIYETAAAEVNKRQQAFQAAVASVQTMVRVADSDEQVAKPLGGQNVRVRPSPEQIARYRMLLHRALAQAQDAQ